MSPDKSYPCVSPLLVRVLFFMWFNHPKYLCARSRFCSELSLTNLRNLHSYLPKILFICGGDAKYCPNRSVLEGYIGKHHPNLLTFRAEYAWEVINKQTLHEKSVNALSLEEWLADFSDVVIILVESFGTVAELGAFSLSPALRKKLLPILDKNYSTDESFINTGPVRWVDLDSKYGPSIYTDFSTILTCMPEVEHRISKNRYGLVSQDQLYGLYRYSKKVLLFFILYIVSSFGPVPTKEVVGIVNDVIQYKDRKIISFVLSIGVALGLFNEHIINGESYFTCFDYEKLFRHDETSKLLHGIQRSRARTVSTLMMIQDYKNALRKVVEDAA